MLPLQSCQSDQLQLDAPKRLKSTQPSVERTLSGIRYVDPQFTLTSLALLLPPCPIVLWDASTGRLDVDLGPHAARFQSFQDRIIDRVESAFKGQKPYFHSMLHGTILTAYIHIQTTEPYKQTEVYQGGWKTLDEARFQKGHLIRLGIQFQGVCFLYTQGTQERKYRLQHHVKVVYA